MSKKRLRTHDSDDDDEMWSEAVLFEEAIIRTQATHQDEASSSRPFPSNISEIPQTSSKEELQKKIDKLLSELMKKAREKLDLINEINQLKASNLEFCEKNCKKQLTAVNTDLRFKENELADLRKRVKELSAKLETFQNLTSSTKSGSATSSRTNVELKIPSRLYPLNKFTPRADLQILEDFVNANPSDVFVRKQFIRWGNKRGDTEITNEYLNQIDKLLPEAFSKVLQGKDPDVWASFIEFLSWIQNDCQTVFCNKIDWRKFLTATKHKQRLLEALICFLKDSPDATQMFFNIRKFIIEEENWRSPDFELILTSAIDFVSHQSLSYDGEHVAKEILRVYRQTLDTDSDPDVMERLMTSSLKLMFQGVDLDGELVSVVTRAEAFHHLGDVLKKVIRWQPTLSHTGCPEMMEIAEMSFRDK